MSTIFGIYKRKINIALNNSNLPNEDDKGNIINIDNDFIEIFYRGNGGYCKFINDLGQYLSDDLKVYPLDNTAQGIYTIGDCKKELKEYLNRE